MSDAQKFDILATVYFSQKVKLNKNQNKNKHVHLTQNIYGGSF